MFKKFYLNMIQTILILMNINKKMKNKMKYKMNKLIQVEILIKIRKVKY